MNGFPHLQPNLADDFLFNERIQNAINNRMNNANHEALQFMRQHQLRQNQQREIQQNDRQSGKSKRASPLRGSPTKKTRYSAGKRNRKSQRKHRR
jgi:hypothetical protein